MDLSQTDLPADFVRDRLGDTRFDCVRVHLAPAYTVYVCTFFDGAQHTSTVYEVHTRRRTNVGFEGKGADRRRVVVPAHEYLASTKEFGRFAWAHRSLASAIARGDKLTLHPTMRD